MSLSSAPASSDALGRREGSAPPDPRRATWVGAPRVGRLRQICDQCLSWVDAVEKSLAIIGFAVGGRFRPIPGLALPPDRRTPEPTCQASYAIGVHTPSVGGPSRRSAIVLRFCTIATRWNSLRAPVRPRRRIRSKPCWTFRCAKRISTFLRALLDRSNAGVPLSDRCVYRKPKTECTGNEVRPRWRANL